MNFIEIFEMDNKTYDRLKYIVQIIFPALATFVGVLGSSLNWPHTTLVVTIMTAVTAMLGTSLGISSHNYNKE